MSDIKEKHPSWFKMKIERRQLIKQLPTETAVNVLLACYDYLFAKRPSTQDFRSMSYSPATTT